MSDHTQQKSWFSRNWLWFVPVSGCLVVILLFVLGIGGLVFGVSKLFTGSEPYQYALEQVKSNPSVLLSLGEPIEIDGMASGSVSIKNEDGNANLNIPIKGANGEARVIVIATKDYGNWVYEELYVQIKNTNEKINLLDKSLEGI